MLSGYDFFYLTQHWIFTISYYRVALIFKLVFSHKSEEINKKLRCRTIFINVLMGSVLIIFCLPYALTSAQILGQEAYYIIDFLNFLFIIVILWFSIWRIRGYTRILSAKKMFINEKLMIIHLTCFSVEAIIVCSNSALLYAYGDISFDEMNLTQLRTTLAFEILTYF